MRGTPKRGVHGVLADHGDPRFFVGTRKSVRLAGTWDHPALNRLPMWDFVRDVALGTKCWLSSLQHPGREPFVTTGYTSGFVFAALQLAAKPFVRPRTHVMHDLLLDARRRGLLGLYERAKLAVFSRAVDLAVVWGKTDVELYAREHGIPPERLQFHPYHITLEKYSFEIRDEGYVFAGGNGGRDYETLIEAVKDLDRPVFIATTMAHVQRLAAPLPHITVRGVSFEEFRRKMAGATVVVECHDPGFFRTAGHQSMLNAMWLGKPMVLAGQRSAVGYLEHEVEGLVVCAGDSAAVRSQILRLLGSPDLRRRLGEAGMRKARDPRYRTANTMQSIYNLAIRIECDKQGIDPEPYLLHAY